MSPVGFGQLSLTKFYRIRDLVIELGRIRPGMTRQEVRAVLGRGHKELNDDLVLYTRGRVVDDPLLAACRARAGAAAVVWVGLVMADSRLATVVETVMTDERGKLVTSQFHADGLARRLQGMIPGGSQRKTATNVLSYYGDSGVATPRRAGATVVGVASAPSTAYAVPAAVAYIGHRLRHLDLFPLGANSDVEAAIRVKAHHWLNLTEQEFRAAAIGVRLRRARGVRRAQRARIAAPRKASRVAEVDVEAHNTDRYTVLSARERLAERREQPLVRRYKAWIEARGSRVVRLRFWPAGTNEVIVCDLYDVTRNVLVEAKGMATRALARMAVGQLFDYRRLMSQAPRLAVLFPARPSTDVERMMSSLGIATIWQADKAFEDNTGGQLI